VQATLEAWDGERLVFASDGRWLYPLLELAESVREGSLDAARLVVRDRIVGRAAALVLVHIGVRTVHAGILSEPGRDALAAHAVEWSCDELVGRIACRTEALLLEETDPAAAFRLVAERAAQAPPRNVRSASREVAPE
jgi:zinc transport system ATP-binding protein